jgi:hypothetical protein
MTGAAAPGNPGCATASSAPAACTAGGSPRRASRPGRWPPGSSPTGAASARTAGAPGSGRRPAPEPTLTMAEPGQGPAGIVVALTRTRSLRPQRRILPPTGGPWATSPHSCPVVPAGKSRSPASAATGRGRESRAGFLPRTACSAALPCGGRRPSSAGTNMNVAARGGVHRAPSSPAAVSNGRFGERPHLGVTVAAA